MLEMKPIEKRTVDTQYRRTLQEILERGERTTSQQEEDCYTLIAPSPMRFKLDNGFPLITERNMAPKSVPIPQWQQAIGEICAFVNGARTLAAMGEFGCTFWKLWATEEKCRKRGLPPGDLGPGSYGAAFHDFPMPSGNSFNQFADMVEEVKELPHLRTHFITPWIPFYVPRRRGKQQKVVVAPCHGWVHIRIVNGKLTLHMFQRSADMVLGVPNNMTQYAALTMMVAQVTGYSACEYVHSFSDAHIYMSHLTAVEKMLAREEKTLPTVTVDGGVKDIFSFRREHFTLLDYYPHPGIKNLNAAI